MRFNSSTSSQVESKAIRFTSGAREELYDLKDDPFEVKNLLLNPNTIQVQALSKLRAELDKLKP
jgi:hypothetical protein